jgi:hypothetical protein
MKNGPYELLVAPENYPGKKYRGRYAYAHHISYWTAFGVTVLPGQVIHHLNGDKMDNRIENLDLTTSSEHSKMHGKKKPYTINCVSCKKDFDILPSKYRTRLRRNKSSYVFCSTSCGAKFQFSKK